MAEQDPARVATKNQIAWEAELTGKPPCCGTPSWRGRFCEFHNGFAAGYELALAEIEREGKA